MANIALKSGASGAANGTSWTDAYTTAAAALAADAAGDHVLVSPSHSETTGTAITLAFAGTLAAPSMMICADDAAWPPTAESTGAVIATTGISNILITGSVKVNGVEFRAGSSSNTASISYVQDAGYGHFVDCTFYLTNSSVSSRIAAGNSTQKIRVRYDNCWLRFSNASQFYSVANAVVEFNGGGLAAGTTSPTALWAVLGSNAGSFRALGCDLSAGSAGMHLLKASAGSGLAVLSNLILPASWTGDLIESAPTAYGMRAEMYDCISGSDRILCRVQDYAGKVSDDQVRVRSGGASIDGIDYSLKFATTANASAVIPLRGPTIPHTPVSGGSSVTATVKLMIDDATAWTAADAALVVMYRPTSGSPQLVMTTTEISVLDAAPATLNSDTDTWVETGVANVQKRALSVTFTPQEDGYLVAWLEVYKPSATLYCDHKLTVA